jgi:exodeoxyribonuclease VII large subunit
MQENTTSLFELALMLESYIDDAFGGQYYWVTAEIASINVRRGHCYLNLIEKDPGSAFPKAEMKAIIWQNNYARINEKFASVTGFDLKQDISILFLTTLNYSPRYGFSLNIIDIKGEYTLGEMMLERQQTIALLIQNKLYELNKNIAFPDVPQRIAALSASDSKGFEDFQNVLNTNPHGYQFCVKLFPVLLQGNKAAESIAQQLKTIEQQKEAFDIVILVRGGGGNVDLHCFNAYILAEAIAKCSLPVITGIGHTTDYTVADEVAAIHKETPTAVAQFIVSECRRFEEMISEQSLKLGQMVIRLLDDEEHYLEKTSHAIQLKPLHLVQYEKVSMSRSSAILSTNAMAMLKVAHSSIESTKKEMNSGLHRFFQKETDLFPGLEKLIKANDPMLLLKKGYSLTRLRGKIIHEISQLKEGDDIETLVSGGTIQSKVQTIVTKEKK